VQNSEGSIRGPTGSPRLSSRVTSGPETGPARRGDGSIKPDRQFATRPDRTGAALPELPPRNCEIGRPSATHRPRIPRNYPDFELFPLPTSTPPVWVDRAQNIGLRRRRLHISSLGSGGETKVELNPLFGSIPLSLLELVHPRAVLLPD